MKALAALLIVLACTGPAHAQPVDMDTLRLQTAETAIRAHANHPNQMIIRNAPHLAAETERSMPLRPSGQPREFAVPPRMDVMPSAKGLQALIAASNSRTATTPAQRQP